MALEFYDNYINTQAKTPKEHWVDGAQAFVDYGFENASTLYTIKEEVTFGEQDYEDIVVRLNHIIKSQTSVNNSEDFKKIIFSDNDKIVGSGYKYQFNGYTWLTTAHDAFKYPTNAVAVRRCNHNLKWYNDEGKLIEEPCIVDYFKFSKVAGINESKVMILPDNQRMLIMQKNNRTDALNYSKRFIFNRMAWKIIDYDRTNEEGLILITVLKDFYDASKDDMENEIAVNKDPKSVYTISILNGNIETDIGGTIQLSTEVKIDGVISSGDSITYSSSDDNIATVSETGLVTGIANGSVTITAGLTNNMGINDSINSTIKVAPANNIIEEIIGDDDISVELTESYSIYKYVNGVAQADTFTFVISNSSVSMSNITGNTVLLTGINRNNSTVILTATNNITSDVINKTINISGLW